MKSLNINLDLAQAEHIITSMIQSGQLIVNKTDGVVTVNDAAKHPSHKQVSAYEYITAGHYKQDVQAQIEHIVIAKVLPFCNIYLSAHAERYNDNLPDVLAITELNAALKSASGSVDEDISAIFRALESIVDATDGVQDDLNAEMLNARISDSLQALKTYWDVFAEHGNIPTDAESAGMLNHQSLTVITQRQHAADVIAYMSMELLPALSDMSDAYHKAVNAPDFNPHIREHFQSQLPKITQSLATALVDAPQSSDTTSRLYQLIKHYYDAEHDMLIQTHGDIETEGMYVVRDALANSSELLETALDKIKPKLS